MAAVVMVGRQPPERAGLQWQADGWYPDAGERGGSESGSPSVWARLRRSGGRRRVSSGMDGAYQGTGDVEEERTRAVFEALSGNSASSQTWRYVCRRHCGTGRSRSASGVVSAWCRCLEKL